MVDRLDLLYQKIKMITWFKHGIAKTNSTILDKSHDTKNSKIFMNNASDTVKIVSIN